MDEVEAPRADIGLKQLRGPIAVNAGLSVLIGFADAGATAGLAGYLASGLGQISNEMIGGLAWIATPWAIAGLTVGTFVLNLISLVLREQVTTKWESERRTELIDAYAQSDFLTQQQHSGARLTVASEQITSASGMIGTKITLLNSAIRTTIYVVGALWTSWEISLVAGVSGAILVGSLRLVSLKTRVLTRRAAAEGADLGEEIGEMALSWRELHLLNRWDAATDGSNRRIETLRQLKFRARSLAGIVGPLFAVGTGLVGLAVGLLNRRAAGVEIAALAASGFLLIRALGSAQSTQTAYQQLHDINPFVDRTAEIIGFLRSKARLGTEVLDTTEPSLKVSEVSLSHGNDTVVSDLSFELGGTGGIAIVGPSGSGKSTTLVALAGLIRPSSGTISVNGADLQSLSRTSLSNSVGLLPQDPKLLKDTLRANLSRPELTDDDDLLDAIQQVNLEATVAEFSEGLDSQVGRAAEGFSGGELQRLGLARLMVNQPHIWLLDEPTSALDRANSDRVSTLISSAMQDHLVILVTHRPDLLASCKRVLVMIDGQLIDDGPVDEVARRQPFLALMLGEENEPDEESLTSSNGA